MTTQTVPVIAVSGIEFIEFGCPHCGYRSGTSPISGHGSAVFKCGSADCGKISCILAQGITKSSIGFGGFYPELQAHPRRGIPSHGQPDKRPEGGGEFFRSRGIGMDHCSCFVCGTKGLVYLSNIAAFVQCKEAGERVVAMFSQGARLDYRAHEPDRVQVKIGACDEHLSNLERLDTLTRDGIITKARITSACS